MLISQFRIVSKDLSPFQLYLLQNSKVKSLCKEFDFYNIRFYREEKVIQPTICLDYPKGNLYWYLDFAKQITARFLESEGGMYASNWESFLDELKIQVRNEFQELKNKLDHLIFAKDVIQMQLKYQLRQYQAYDLLRLKIKFDYWNKRSLILSDPRTGKTRIALAMCVETLKPSDVALVVCPKSAQIGWEKEINILNEGSEKLFKVDIVTKPSSLKNISLETEFINVRVITYDLFKRLTVPQIRQLTSNSKHIMLLGDEIHRLRNFKTQQSSAIYAFKDFCKKDRVDLGILGLSATPAIKESEDPFGTLCLVNDSKIAFRPTWEAFNCFKEYFYFCEDTSFGKITKSLRRENELNYLLQTCSVQTKQRELSLFQNYTKTYKKIELDMDNKQREIYESVYENMEYDEDIDCQNKLVQLVRLQQICVDPFGLVSSYENISPKLRWIVGFAKKNPIKFIVACKKTKPLLHLMEVLDKAGLKHASLIGSYSHTERKNQLEAFETQPDVKIMLLQSDTGRESLTLPMAQAIIFLDRDFAQGFNEQAEARMTPIDGATCTKYVIDLVMKGSKEEEIYNTLIIKKKSIDATNLVFKPKKGV